MVLMLLAGAGYGSKPAAGSAPGPAPAAAYKLKIGTQLWPGALPIYVALAAGLAEKSGIEIKDIIVASGADRRAALLAGEIQFAEFAFTNIAVAAERNVPLMYIASIHDYEMFSFLVRSALKDKVKTIQDLKGLKVGYSTPGAGAWGWARVYLKGSGLDPDKDVDMIGGLSSPDVVLAALKSGKVDAYATWEPITTQAVRTGVAYPLVKIWDPADHEKWMGRTAMGSGLTTTAKLINAEPGMVIAMVAMVKAGLAYIRSHTPGEIANLLQENAATKRYWGSIDRDFLAEMIERSMAAMKVTDGRLSRSGFDNEMKAHVIGGVIKQMYPFDKVVNASFAGEKP